MGTSLSKSSPDPQHVFAANHPVRFSESLAHSLQNNPETDSTRAKNIELIIQARVTSELEKHLAASTDKLSSLSESISQEPLEKSQKKASAPSLTEKPLLTRISEKLTGSESSEPEQTQSTPGLDRNAVAKDLEELRKKLNSRKKIVEKDVEVEKAKDQVVACLRKNDRRPLDCWKEVEKFKLEVGRLERGFVDRTAG